MGSTTISLSGPERIQDHPHIHGEHTFYGSDPSTGEGSPPYTWGALAFLFFKHFN